MTATSVCRPACLARTIGVAVLVTLALVAAGCSSGNGSTETETVASPIAEFLGQSDFLNDPEAAEAQFAEQERERQEIIARCMKEQGFEYVPIDTSSFTVFGGEGEEEWGSDVWVAKYGFGITTQRFSQDQVGPDLIGYDESMFGEQMTEDPNQAIVEALSPGEQEAYYEALYGGEDSFPRFDESLTEEEIQAQMEDFVYEPQGCEGEAYTEDAANRFYTDFSDELQEMEERIQADPRVAAKQQEVSDCVAGKGLTYTGMEDLYQSFEQKMQDIDSQISYPGEELTDEDFAQMSEEELDELFNTPPELPDEAKAKLGELQAEEIELAKAVSECGGGFTNEFELYNEVRVEYEQEFLDRHADELEAYRAG